jgi:hypothetical protein
MASDDPEMLRWVTLASELDPDAFLTLWGRQIALNALRDWPRAIETGRAVLAVSGRTLVSLAQFGLALHGSGDVQGARAVLEEMRLRAQREWVGPTMLALLEAALGETAAAITHCREAIAIRDPGFVIFARGWPHTEALRSLPEHQAMLREIGLPDRSDG